MAESFWLTCVLCRYLTIHPCVLSSEPLSWSVVGPSQAPNDESEKSSEMLCGFEAENAAYIASIKVDRAAVAEILPSDFFYGKLLYVDNKHKKQIRGFARVRREVLVSAFGGHIFGRRP